MYAKPNKKSNRYITNMLIPRGRFHVSLLCQKMKKKRAINEPYLLSYMYVPMCVVYINYIMMERTSYYFPVVPTNLPYVGLDVVSMHCRGFSVWLSLRIGWRQWNTNNTTTILPPRYPRTVQEYMYVCMYVCMYVSSGLSSPCP